MTSMFDQKIDRRNTHSMKWDEMESRYGISSDDGLPMWVADMDFRPPQAVNDMLARAAEHGINGYYGNDAPFKDAVISWMKRHHQFEVKPDWISTVPGVVAGYSMAIQAFSQEGDGVLVFSPVYHAFGRAIRDNKRRLVESQLVERDGAYYMDFDNLAKQVDERTKILLLCSPHNPGGRVWTTDELTQICEFCLERDILIISDEIHHDLILDGSKHVVTATLSEAIAERTVTFTSASKTFNLAGFATAACIISNTELRRQYGAVTAANGVHSTPLGSNSTTEAYNHGDAWLEEVCSYIAANQELLIEGLEAAIPGAKVMRMASTYLQWVDFKNVDLPFDEIVSRIQKQAKIAVNVGSTFGKGGETFLRFNLACPKSTVEEAIKRLESVFADLRVQSTV
ncbi:Cystathionine beta-lyase PatB [Pseudovibrio axinellae]|uniref:cysteine-S-conjugate beta-lyase n=1 Tax=Pseudovibrio axinellae TaxID=989403 RepID=A0A165YIC4_9HYPH|nr:MalY/PatB family protein [Pseudovibrio axinellae]KZL18867.1 Cystathionine beta-lyase PatB [Pseudovibrio axinellae]SEP89740.1 cystathione beta-lyase [Pseudovibrio axinellae]